MGKNHAMDTLLKNIKGDFVILLDADVFFEKDAFKKLLVHFKDKSIGGVAANKWIINPKKSFWGIVGRIIPAIREDVLEKQSKKGEFTTLCGNLSAIRNIVHEMPHNIINDDVYIGIKIKKKWYKVIYDPGVHVKVKHVTNMKEYFRERKRIRLGHYQIEKMFGKSIVLTKTKGTISLLLGQIVSFKSFFAVSIVVVVEILSELVARIQILTGGYSTRWKINESTK